MVPAYCTVWCVSFTLLTCTVSRSFYDVLDIATGCHVFFSAASGPPVGVSVQDGSTCYTSVVSWSVPNPVCGVTFVIGNYSVRYRLMNGGAFTTVFSSSTSVTLQGLMVNTEYSVSVAAISSNGNLSAYTGPTQFMLQGDLYTDLQF